jgi:hypothetical protein
MWEVRCAAVAVWLQLNLCKGSSGLNCVVSFPNLRLRAVLTHGASVLRGCTGTGLSRLDAAIIFEALSWGDVPVAAYLSIHNMVCSGEALGCRPFCHKQCFWWWPCAA